MSMLLQQIRRSTYSRRGTAAALTPSPNTFSRVFSTTNRALGPEKEETFAEVLELLSKDVLKYGLTGSFVYGTYYWFDYGGYRKMKKEMEKIETERNIEWDALSKAKKELYFLREKAKGR